LFIVIAEIEGGKIQYGDEILVPANDYMTPATVQIMNSHGVIWSFGNISGYNTYDEIRKVL